MRDGTVPHGPALLADQRVRIVNADILMAIAEARDTHDLLLLDVDNGPGYLVHDGNADVYGRDFLARCRDDPQRPGRLVVWSAARAPELLAALRTSSAPPRSARTTSCCRTARRSTSSTSRDARPRTSRGEDSPRPFRGSVEAMSETRTEHDSMGEVEVPADALWRAQTQRAIDNFPISGTHARAPPRPGARAWSRPRPPRVNGDLGVHHAEQAAAIADAAARGGGRASTTTTSRSTSSRPGRAPAPT